MKKPPKEERNKHQDILEIVLKNLVLHLNMKFVIQVLFKQCFLFHFKFKLHIQNLMEQNVLE